MQIRFRTKALQRQYERHEAAEKAYGAVVARKYIQRINIIKASKTLRDLMDLRPLRCHPLKGKRRGQYAINLTGFYRLIFSLEGEMLEIVRIEEVSKHYGD